MRPVQEGDGKWYVYDDHGNRVAGPFNTEGEAWAAVPVNAPPPPRPRF